MCINYTSVFQIATHPHETMLTSWVRGCCTCASFPALWCFQKHKIAFFKLARLYNANENIEFLEEVDNDEDNEFVTHVLTGKIAAKTVFIGACLNQ